MMIYIIGSVATGVAGILIYIYYLRQGQFEDLEDVKYQMFRDEKEK
ncbi:MAG: cbb3-type cytochrome oxidase assembly protein [Chlamydiales bacterium]|nr:cbb3-type cytochrome oxidase assembly protein [Chlamydiia bacterium]MCP5507465.1 cbb3-type cytochrome oxidase assembly protein [Chlamydiales bacterium]